MKRVGKDAVLRLSSFEEEEEASVPKPVKENKRKRASVLEDPKSKKSTDRKPKKNTISLTVESVLRLRDEDDDEEENDGSALAARKKKSIDAPKAAESMVIYKAPPRTEEISKKGLGKVPESLEIEDASYRSQQMVVTSEGAGSEAPRIEENAPSESPGAIAVVVHREACSRSRAELYRFEIDLQRVTEERNSLKLLLRQKGEEIKDLQAELAKAHQDQTDLSEKLQTMKEKSSVQVRRIEELEAQLASELAKAESDAEKAKVDVDAFVDVYRANAEAAQIQAKEAAKIDNTRAHWVAELTKCRSRRETLEEIHARCFDLIEEIKRDKKLKADTEALVSDDDDDDDDDDGSKSGSESGEEPDGEETAPEDNQET
ncbi:KNR4/SMI1 homolog [Nicotiana tomentosiformis]|uniref:KNR4/SMI1 homolog n=1 Tax=Nicotiana tomentosiformis TaxID=4098 RepID=UPI00388CA8C8